MISSRMRALALVTSSCFAAAWAAFLATVHVRAAKHALEPGLLCGADGGCGDVLTSEWSTLFGVPVSAPAVPLFAALAFFGGAVASGKADAARVSAWATTTGLAAMSFGGFLLYHMLADIGTVCRYCLVMDAGTLAVLASALFLHPEGPRGALRGVPASLSSCIRPGPELGTALVTAIGMGLLVAFYEEPAEEHLAVEAVLEGAAPQRPLASGQAENTGEKRRVVIPKDVDPIPLDGKRRIRGKKDAPIVVALFEDFQCPYCRKLTANLDALLHEKPDQVRLVWFDFPMHRDCNAAELKKDLHADACRAAAAGVCADQQEKFWPMHDIMFQNSAKLSSEDLLSYAERLRLDVATFRQCLNDEATQDAIREESKVGAGLGVTGTPAFFVNGRRFSGAQPVEVLRAVVDALAKEPSDRVLLDVNLEGELLGEVGSVPTEVQLSGPRGKFRIDAFEASIVGGKAVSKPGVEPARGLTWFEADAACRAAGKRLCTEDEWLFACTGALPADEDGDGLFSDERIRGRAQPYGAWRQEKWCATTRPRDDARPLITGNHPRCVTPDGVYDLEGVTKEWIGLAPDRAGLKGGSYFSGESARCGYFREDDSPYTVDRANGFRCCSGPAPDVADRHPGGKVGDHIRDWSRPLMDGGTISTADLRGKPYVITFWASWCGPCRQEMPVLSEVYDKYKDKGLTVVGIDIDQDVGRARAFLAKNPVTFPIALDPESQLMNQFATRGTPTTFWVTKSGIIRQRTVGYDEKGTEKMEANVEALLAAE